MSTMKNDQILLYCHFDKIKGPGAKNMLNIFHTAYYYLTKFHFDRTQDSKEISISVTQQCQPLRSNVYDDVTDFEICGFHKNKKVRGGNLQQEIDIICEEMQYLKVDCFVHKYLALNPRPSCSKTLVVSIQGHQKFCHVKYCQKQN